MQDDLTGGARADEQKAEQRQKDVRERSEERETRQTTPTETEKPLTRGERNDVAQHGKLSALTVYSIVMREGEEELHRPKASLWWSGVAAGIGISTSVLAEGIIRADLGSDFPYLNLIESIGYTFGFVLVILCRLQLFTENTITVVLPVLADPSRNQFYATARLWGIVFLANMCGTLLTATLTVHAGTLKVETLAAILEISRHLAEIGPMDSMLRGIPAGFFIAALVWMLPSAKGSEVLAIMVFTWLISAGGFTHVIAGSTEIFTLVLNGEMGIVRAFAAHIFPTLVGNILGGTVLFAVLAYGQIRNEM